MRIPSRTLLLLAALLATTFPAGAAGAQQSVSANVGAAQRAPDPSAPGGYRDTALPGCGDGRFSPGTPASVLASVSCTARGAAFRGTGSAAFGGPLGATGGITGGLTAQPAGFDYLTIQGTAARLDDRLLFSGTGVTPASFALQVQVTGGSIIRDLSPNAVAYTQGFVGLITPGLPNVPLPWGAPSGWGAYANFETLDGGAVRTAGPATFAGTHVASVAGVTTAYTTNGLITFGNIPVLPGGSTAFALVLQFAAAIYNNGTTTADIRDEATFDYSRVTIAGIRVFDAAGNDVTDAARPVFGSGATLAVVPEPATWALVGAGLAIVGLGRRRRRRAGRA